MNSDPKVAFYLEHRELIEEWAPLRDVAAKAIASALERACRVDLLQQHGSAIKAGPSDPGRMIMKYVPSEQPSKKAYVELLWKIGSLCKPGDRAEWPVLSIVVDPKTAPELRESVLQATGVVAAACGLEWSDHDWWVLSTKLRPDPADIDLDEYAADCFQKLRDLYDGVADILVDTVNEFESRAPREQFPSSTKNSPRVWGNE